MHKAPELCWKHLSCVRHSLSSDLLVLTYLSLQVFCRLIYLLLLVCFFHQRFRLTLASKSGGSFQSENLTVVDRDIQMLCKHDTAFWRQCQVNLKVSCCRQWKWSNTRKHVFKEDCHIQRLQTLYRHPSYPICDVLVAITRNETRLSSLAQQSRDCDCWCHSAH